MNSPVATSPHGIRRSTAMLVLQVCGNLKLGSVSATSALVGGTVTVLGLYLSGLGLNGKAVVLSTDVKPLSMPVLPIWFEIQTYSGFPVNTPVPPRSCGF